MKQYTVTYRTTEGWAKFVFIDADSKADARAAIALSAPGAVVVSVRENNPPLTVITAQD